MVVLWIEEEGRKRGTGREKGLEGEVEGEGIQ